VNLNLKLQPHNQMASFRCPLLSHWYSFAFPISAITCDVGDPAIGVHGIPGAFAAERNLQFPAAHIP
jgi:hypothetical protein